MTAEGYEPAFVTRPPQDPPALGRGRRGQSEEPEGGAEYSLHSISCTLQKTGMAMRPAGVWLAGAKPRPTARRSLRCR